MPEGTALTLKVQVPPTINTKAGVQALELSEKSAAKVPLIVMGVLPNVTETLPLFVTVPVTVGLVCP